MRMPARTVPAAVALIGAVLLCACPQGPARREAKPPTEVPAVEIAPPAVCLITQEDYPGDWSTVIDMPGADDPRLRPLAERILYPSGLDRHCDELPYHAWEVFAERLQEQIDEEPSAFAWWLHANVQLKLWWCGPADDPVYLAEDSARRAWELAPDSSCVLAAMALVDSCLNRPDAALQRIEMAVAARPDLVYPLVIKGLIHRHQDDWEAAIEAYDLALEQNVRAVVVNLYRGHVYYDMAEYEKSLAAYEVLAAQAPDYGPGHLNCAYLYYKFDRDDEAFDAAARAAECDNRISEAHRLLGTIHYERSEYEDARLALEWALTLDPDNDNAHYYMGHYYYSSSLLGKSVDSYLKADELSPDEAETWCSLGRAYYLMGEAEQATEALEKAMDLSEPGYWAYDDAVATLAEMTAPEEDTP